MSLAGFVMLGLWTHPVAGAIYTVAMTSSDRFSPASLSIAEGDTVTWTNTSSFSAHTSTSGVPPTGDGHWASPSVNPGGSFSFTFTNLPPQSYAYFCAFHYSFGMTGTLTITNNAITPVTLENPIWTNGQFRFTVNGTAGRTYVTEISSNFTQWVPVQTNVAPSNRFSISDPFATGHMSFYRVSVKP
jgi:plastocyanin